jgi:hypothetical protein
MRAVEYFVYAAIAGYDICTGALQDSLPGSKLLLLHATGRQTEGLLGQATAEQRQTPQ